jgi:hypothetical protein
MKMARSDNDMVQKLVTEDSFVNGVFVPAGHPASYSADQLTGKEPHIHDMGDYTPVVVEQAAISPTGPNPTTPQQIPADAVQTAGGGYVRPGVELRAEVTAPRDTRLAGRSEEGDTTEGDVMEELKKANEETARLRAQLAAAQNRTNDRELRPAGSPVSTQDDNDGLVEGTVADIVAALGGKTDDEIEAMRKAEVDREKPRKGVLDAIKAEQRNRKG